MTIIKFYLQISLAVKQNVALVSQTARYYNNSRRIIKVYNVALRNLYIKIKRNK